MPKKLQNLEGVYKFLNDTVSVEDFLDAFKKIMKFLDEKRGEDREELNKMSALVAEKLVEAMDKIEKEKDRLNDEEKKLKQIQKETLLDLSDKQKAFAELIRSKVESIKVPKDGKDADEVDQEEIAMSVYDMLLEKIPSLDELENDLPKHGERIRDSLELLQGDERLSIDAIKGLTEELKKIGRSVGALGGAGASLPLASWPVHEQFTMDGVATSVVLSGGIGAGGNACIIRYQGQTLDMTSQYTVSGNTVTLVGFVPEVDTIISVTYWR
jgi:hypothetical protein